MADFMTQQARRRRKRRVAVRVRGTAERPRLSVFRSNRYLSAQLIDDRRGVTLASAREARSLTPSSKGTHRNSPRRAAEVGTRIAELAKANGIHAVRFDRGRYRYHGLVAMVAAGARKGGLKL